jgi:acetyltransferase-like isoleucine patch superfamily enzyme
MKSLLRKSRLWRRIEPWVWASGPLSARERWLNWFVQRFIYRTRNLTFSVHFTSRISHVDRIRLGKNVWYQLAASGGCYIQGNNGIEIGDDTLIAAGVKIISANHSLRDYSKHEPAEPVRIGKRCWLGVNSTILPGIQLGDEVIVGAGSVVTRSFESRSIIAGVPARLIRKIDHEEPIVPLFKEPLA